jgi:hypothetical protein
VDSGGVTNELFTAFYQQIFDPALGYFTTCGDDDNLYTALNAVAAQGSSSGGGDPAGRRRSGSGPAAPSSSHYVLPARWPRGAGPDPRLPHFRSLGRVFAKSILSQCPAPRCLAPSLLRHLLGLPPILEDALAFDPVAGRSLQAVAAASPSTFEAMCLFNDEEDEEADVASRRRSVAPASPLPLTAGEQSDYVARRVRALLLEGREAALDALAKGLADVPLVYEEVRRLSPKGLREALCGKSRLRAEDLRAVLYTDEAVARGPGPARSVVFLLELLDVWEGQEGRLRQLLLLLTGLQAIPLAGLRNADASPKDRIKVLPCACTNCRRGRPCEQLPAVSTCFYTLRLPTCETRAELERRLLIAADFGAMGFGAV